MVNAIKALFTKRKPIKIPDWLEIYIDSERRQCESILEYWKDVNSARARNRRQYAAERLEEIQKFLSEVK